MSYLCCIFSDTMGKKGKKKGGEGKKSGKKSGKSTAKKPAEPQMTIREAIIAYQ